ncbi:inner membrane CreD family protein [Salmonella enterica subsp. enterica]|nr:inner membrane CreD family protein [Salmonella enterica subsp. enterica]
MWGFSSRCKREISGSGFQAQCGKPAGLPRISANSLLMRKRWIGTTCRMLGRRCIDASPVSTDGQRATKYAILLITLTFMAFAFENPDGQRRHPDAVSAGGLSLVMFYLLLRWHCRNISVSRQPDRRKPRWAR